ncbi:MAG: hypothetical protein LLG06_20390 [Desulfobacteraceae bacterium]|nr:hypothetical protein [Desulfobacteraceae bacterium]
MKRLFLTNIEKIRDINKKYTTREVEMSRTVSLSLLFIRIYLIFIVCLLVYKFITLL